MVRILNQDVPPSLSWRFFRILGPPKTTGFDVFLPSYTYGIGRALARRHPFRFPNRQGFTMLRVTPAQRAQRLKFRAALDIWATQPYTTPTDTTYGPKGHNIWRALGQSFNHWAINYFMSCQLPYEATATPAPWDPHHFLVLFATITGDQTGFIQSPALPPGTYRVAILEDGAFGQTSPQSEVISRFIYAASVYSGSPESPVLESHIGVGTPDASHNYETWADCPDNQPDAWTAYLASDPQTVDVTLDTTSSIMLQFKNEIAGDQQPNAGTLQFALTSL